MIYLFEWVVQNKGIQKQNKQINKYIHNSSYFLVPYYKPSLAIAFILNTFMMNTEQLDTISLQKNVLHNPNPSYEFIKPPSSYNRSSGKIKSLNNSVQILHQVKHHSVSSSSNPISIHDYICLKDSQSPNGKNINKNISLHSSQTPNPNIQKRSLIILCQSSPTQQSFQFTQILSCVNPLIKNTNNLSNFSNILPPSSLQHHSISQQNCSLVQICSFVQININHIPLAFSSFDSFLPVSSFGWNPKLHSEIFSLNKFYRFLLTLLKPYYQLIQSLIAHSQLNPQIIELFFSSCLVQENIYYEKHSDAFYLLLLPNRHEKPPSLLHSSKSLKKCQKPNHKHQFNLPALFTHLFKQSSQIFWKIFFPHQHQAPNSNLHASFLQNFLASSINGQLTLDDAIQILESKQKRKSFINQKISLFAHKPERRAMSINYGQSINQTVDRKILQRSRYQMVDMDVSDLNLFNEKLNKKNKSVHRKLTGKRNTIDVFLQHSTQKHIPPSFESRSQQKKTRLFKHDLGYKRKSQSSQSRQKTINNSINFNTLQYENNRNSTLGIHENFSFIGLNNSKGNTKNASKTIEIGQFRGRHNAMQFSNNERENEQNGSYKRDGSKSGEKLLKFIKNNISSRDYLRKSSTQNISSLEVEKIDPRSQIYSKTVTASNHPGINGQKRQSIAATSKNRRYYHINNFISGNQTIQTLIETQKNIQRSTQHSRSKQRDLLNRSQQKAFAIFNKEVKNQKVVINNLQEFEGKSSNQHNDKVHEYLKKKNSALDENAQPKRIQVKQLSGYKKWSEDELSAFSPPKKHKSTHGMRDASAGFKESSEFEKSKVDDRQFRHKFSLHLNRNSISPQEQLHSRQFSTQDRLQLEIKQVEKRALIQKQKKQAKQQVIDMKVNNEYLESGDVEQLDKAPAVQVAAKVSKVMDRTQKGLLNAGKKLSQKLNNKNFNIEQVFAQQQMLTEQNLQLRNMNSHLQVKQQQPKRKFSESEQNKEEDEMKGKNRKYSSNTYHVELLNGDSAQMNKVESSSISRDRLNDDQGSYCQVVKKVKREEIKQVFEELTELISPIKPSSNQQAKPQISNQPPAKSQQNQKKKNGSQKSQSVSSQKQSQDLSSFYPVVKKPTANDINTSNQPKLQPSLPVQKQPPVISPSNTSMPQVIEKIDQTNIKQAVLAERNLINSIPKSSEHQPNTAPNNALKSSQPPAISVKQTKELLNNHPIPQDEQSELEQIKFTPSKSKLPQKTKSTVAKPSLPQNHTQPKSLTSTISKPPLPHQTHSKPQRQTSQPYSPKTHPQVPGSPSNSVKKPKQVKRQATTQSVASSFGPHKTVKKIVEQYVFMVNKIGQAVAKTPKIAKKVQTVTDWYVGAYFLYKRFLYERKKMQKYLKEGTPKITRYDEPINLDDWKEYLKSPERHALMTKVSEENVNIAKSIQKMQSKLLAKNLPESIKQHAAISQRTSRESVIAVDAVIDEFDVLVERGMLVDEDIASHCAEMFNACLIIAELDQLVEDIVPVSEFSKSRRTIDELEMIAQDLYDLYHDE